MNEPATLIDAIRASLAASLATPDGMAPPVALLWTDPDGQWQPLLPALLPALPQLHVLGDYAPAQRRGPVIWLRCVVEGALPGAAMAAATPPILYLPKVARQDLRAAADCRPALQPLLELQYRGAVWHQRNGRDWTVEAFLSSSDALGLDMAQDAAARQALLRALPLLAAEPLAPLRGRRLEAEDFDRLAIGDPVRDLLSWLCEPEAFQERCEESRWAAFRDVCARQFDFDPEQDGPGAAADALTAGQGRWDEVWGRFCEAPHAWRGVAAALRRARPGDLLAAPSRWPAVNEEREDSLRAELKKVASLPHAEACRRVEALDAEHRERRGWVWAQIGHSPCACALEPLGRLARAAAHPLGGASAAALAQNYADEGWRCDRAAIEALAGRGAGFDGQALVAEVVRALYEPWLDASARRLQELLTGEDMSALTAGVDAEAECCILFVDGLRFDLAAMLSERLQGRGLRTRLSHRLAPFPTVTATAKPLASPAHRACVNAASAEDFYPLLSGNGRLADAPRLRDAMARQGVEILDPAAMALATGAEGGAWMETGSIDSRGHALGAALVDQLGAELEALAERADTLLAAGWRKLRIVTDHGWLLLPGGLPRIDLPPWLVESKWARCAAVAGESTPAVPTWPWHWNPLLRIASPPGIGAFRAQVEYAHGGLSPQEWVLPDLIVERGAAAVTATVAAVSWRGMRCRIRVDTGARDLRVDLRLNRKRADSSIAAHIRPLGGGGQASLVVADDSHEGAAAAAVVLDGEGRVLDSLNTTVGGEP